MKSQKRGRRHGIHLSFDPIAIAIDGNQRNGIKRTINTKLTERELGSTTLDLHVITLVPQHFYLHVMART